MSTCCGAGAEAACAADIKSVRNREVSRRRIILCRRRCWIASAPIVRVRSFRKAAAQFALDPFASLSCSQPTIPAHEQYHLETAAKHHKSVVLTGGQATLSMIHPVQDIVPSRAFHGEFRPC